MIKVVEHYDKFASIVGIISTVEVISVEIIHNTTWGN